MKDWQTYAKSAVGNSDAPSQPSVKAYFLIKLSDNWIAVSVLFLFIFCMLAGLISNAYSQGNSEGAKWCFDSAKLCLGVFLGLLKK